MHDKHLTVSQPTHNSIFLLVETAQVKYFIFDGFGNEIKVHLTCTVRTCTMFRRRPNYTVGE